jgi:putative intracellular protease/amidase
MQTVYLTGGGPGAFTALRRNFARAVSEVGKERPLVAYVGVATGDDPRFFDMITGGLNKKKARIEPVKIAPPRSDLGAARALLDECDLVFMSGGDVDAGMKTLHRKKMDDVLRGLARAGKPMFGVSAGSLMLAQEWVRFRGAGHGRPEIFPCLGVAPIHVDAHSEDDDWSELRILVGLLHRRGDARPTGYGLTRGGGLRLAVDAHGAKKRMAAIGSRIPRLVVKGGAVVHAPPLAPR